MGQKQKHEIRLTEEERSSLIQRTQKGDLSPRKVRRILILLRADKNSENPKQDWEIAEELNCNQWTVTGLRNRFTKEKLQVVEDKPRSGRPKIVDGDAEAHIIAVACSETPKGKERWTLRMIAQRVITLTDMESCSYGTIRNILKKTNLSHGRKENGKFLPNLTTNSSGGWKKF